MAQFTDDADAAAFATDHLLYELDMLKFSARQLAVQNPQLRSAII